MEKSLKKEIKRIAVYLVILILIIAIDILILNSYDSLGQISKNCIENHQRHAAYIKVSNVIRTINLICYLIVLILTIKIVILEKNRLLIRIFKLIENLLLLLIITFFLSSVDHTIAYIFRLDISYWWCAASGKITNE